MLRKILLALDGSENAERALPWVKRYAGPSAAQVVVFRAVPLDGLPPEAVPANLLNARDYVYRLAREFNYAGIPSKIAVKAGHAATAIVKAAVEEGCDLIIMTTRGGSKVARWLVGGVTERVMRLSPIPVLVVRSRMALPHQAHVRRVIVPLDGSKLAESSIPFARSFARLLRARLEFVFVHPVLPTGYRMDFGKTYRDLRRRMEPRVKEITRAGVRASFRVLRGDPASRILGASGPKDLILTTTHGFGGFKRWVFGSVAEKVVRESPVPVLVYKSKAKGKEARETA